MPDKDAASRLQREAVRADWAGRAVHWDRHADQIAEPAVRLNLPLIEAVDIQTGQTVLDIATGAGEPGLTIAGLIGREGRLTMSDMVPEMIAGAERRAVAQGYSNIEFLIADMADLPLEAASFDRAICRFGLMFCPNQAKALSEVFRILKPGGRAAWMVWGPKSANSTFSVIDDVAKDVFGSDNPLLDLERPFSLAESGALENLVRGVGFDSDGEQDILLNPRLPGDIPFWAAMVDMAVGCPRDAADPQARAKFDSCIQARFGDLIENGKYHLAMHARICVGVKPA